MLDKIPAENEIAGQGDMKRVEFKPLYFVLGLLLIPVGFALHFSLRADRPAEAVSVARGALFGLIIVCAAAFVLLFGKVIALVDCL